MEISPGWVSAGATVAIGVGGVLIRWVHGSLKDQRDDHALEVSSIKATQKLLFEKNDTHSREFQDYRLHVAETYVNREILKEQLEPINRALSEIKEEMREERNK